MRNLPSEFTHRRFPPYETYGVHPLLDGFPAPTSIPIVLLGQAILLPDKSLHKKLPQDEQKLPCEKSPSVRARPEKGIAAAGRRTT